jgi:prevent-host-death family protein
VLVVMHVVGSRQLRPRLGEYLERAKDGDEVVVLVYGQPAALLRAVRPDDVGARVPSRFVRDELHKAIGKARATSLVVTWHGRMFAVLQAPPEGLELQEDVS